MDRSRVEPKVWCKRDGPIADLYRKIDVPIEVVGDLPKASSLPRASRNLAQLALLHRDLFRARRTLARLAKEAESVDLVHFNHEGFAHVAQWLRKHSEVPATVHIRTNVVPTMFARAQMRMISRSVDEVVFITSNEESTFRSLGGKAPGTVIRNPVEDTGDAEPVIYDPAQGPLTIASLSNAAWVRGTDRLLLIAEALAHKSHAGVRFLVAGHQALSGKWPGLESEVAGGATTLEHIAQSRGLADYFDFRGHVPDPENVLMQSHLLIKPTRENNPWGRDIIEAMAAGRPVISVGHDKSFVETDETGLLQPEFDADGVADYLIGLSKQPQRLALMGKAAQERVRRLCDPAARASDLAAVWQRVSGV